MAQNSIPWSHIKIAELLESGVLSPKDVPVEVRGQLHQKAAAELNRQLGIEVPTPTKKPKRKKAEKKEESAEDVYAYFRPALASAESRRHTLSSVEVPVPPSVNNLFGTGRPNKKTGKIRRFVTDKYEQWLEISRPLVRQMKPPAEYPVETLLILRGAGINSQRDIANIEKAPIDALVKEEVLAGDQLKYVTGAHQLFRPDDKPPRLEIRLISPVEWRPSDDDSQEVRAGEDFADCGS
jgi:Holliday junction resolvase RusA-like endonuclease